MKCNSASSPTVDAYFAAVPEHLWPVAQAVRDVIRRAAPELRQVIKWSSPCYEGRGLVCAMGVFKQHVRLSFFRGAEVPDPEGLLPDGAGNAAMRSLAFTTVKDIPRAALARLVRAAASLDADGAKTRTPRPRRPDLPVPGDLAKALKGNARARAFFESLPPSCRREYIEWIVTAKRAETRDRRLAATLENLKAGRRRHEEYRR